MSKVNKIWQSITKSWGTPYILVIVITIAGYVPYFLVTKTYENDEKYQLADIIEVSETHKLLSELKNLCYPDPDCFETVATKVVEKQGVKSNFELNLSRTADTFTIDAHLTGGAEKNCDNNKWASRVYLASRNGTLNENNAIITTKGNEVIQSFDFKDATGEDYIKMYESLCSDNNPNFDDFIISQSFRF